MKDPPQTATYARGPFESEDLVEKLGLNNGEVHSVAFFGASEADNVFCRLSNSKSLSLFIQS